MVRNYHLPPLKAENQSDTQVLTDFFIIYNPPLQPTELHLQTKSGAFLYPISQTYIATYHTKQSYGSDTLYHSRSSIISRPKIFATDYLSPCSAISPPRKLPHYKRTYDNIVDIGMRIQDGEISTTLFYSNKNIVGSTDSTTHDIVFVMGQ